MAQSTPDASVTTDNSFLVFVSPPPMPAPPSRSSFPNSTFTKTTLTVGLTTNQASIPSFPIVPDVTQPAAVVSFSPSSLGLDGGARISVTLRNFSLVYSPSEVALFIESLPITVESIDSSTTQQTRLSFFAPASLRGTRQVALWPLRATSNR